MKTQTYVIANGDKDGTFYAYAVPNVKPLPNDGRTMLRHAGEC